MDAVYCSILLFKGRDQRKTGERFMERNAQIQLNGFIWQKHVSNKLELIFSDEIY